MPDANQIGADPNKSCRFFDPYKGDFYGTGQSILSKKMLVVGASHYCQYFYECGNKCGTIAKDQDCSDFTWSVFDTYFSSQERKHWMATYTAFANSVFGYDASFEDRCKFYQSVVFANYLQRTEGKNGNEKHDSWFRNPQNAAAFKQTIAEYVPEVVVIWGVRVWRALPWRDFTFDEAQSTDNVKKCNCQGKSFILMHVHHPSLGYDREAYFALFQENGIFVIDPDNKQERGNRS